jgi:serine/threonine-protein kinase
LDDGTGNSSGTGRNESLREQRAAQEHDPTPSRSAVKDTGKYKLLAELGRGGMANVYLAVARGPSGFNKLVVLKCLRADLANDRELLSMFLDEARLAARLNHPHVVQTYEVGEYAGRPVIVMEYLEGQTLANLLQRAKGQDAMSLSLHLRAIVDALEGLHHAHELTDYAGKPIGLVHRDVSPQNVFVTFDGQVKVLDFGIAKAVTSQSQTSTGILKGKVQYMAPEQMLGAQLDRRADLYAVGVMAWEAAAGQRMWKGFTDLHVMNKVANEGVHSPREVNPQVDPKLEQIVMKALSRDPDNRYATALELAAALESIIEDLGGGSSRALGKLVRELFEDARAQTRAVIEAQLAEVGNTVDNSDAHMVPPNLVTLSMRPDESPPLGTGVTGVATDGLQAAQKPKRMIGAAVGVLLAGGAATAAVLVARGHSQPPVAAAAPVPAAPTPSLTATETAPPPPTAAPTAAFVSVALSTVPKKATLFLDGDQLATNPYTAVLPKDGATHRVRAEYAGYVARTITLTPDHDTDVVVVLDAIVYHGGRAAAAAQAPAAAPPRDSTPPANNKCNPPYYIDAEGIKKYKPECL